jgi:flagellar motor switch protein FliN/FliY
MAETDKGNIPLPDLDPSAGAGAGALRQDEVTVAPDQATVRGAADLEAVFDVPVLGRTRMDVGDLLNLAPGAVLELDRRVGEAIDIYVNNRLVARFEVVLVEESSASP